MAVAAKRRGRPRKDDREQAAKKADAAARRSSELSLVNREIGQIPRIVNVKRREACRLDYKRFCDTYNPAAFSLPWGPDQEDSGAMLEETVLYGALFANAEPRGGGKTTRARMAALWSMSYGHWLYTFVIGSNAGKAQDTLDAIKTFVRHLPLYVADFPEIAYPVKKLGGIAGKAAGQLCQGEPTKIEWGQDRIVLATVPPPPNWPKAWPLRRDGQVPTSGSIVGVSGLTGEGIRGSVITLTTGEQIRPDGVLLDDPQTDESAASPIQNQARESLISGAVLGMAAPGKTIAAVMACTPIRPGDMADRMLDREKHPLWRGRRMKMLRTMPTDIQAWEPYFVIYRACAQKSPPDYREANAYYTKNRAALDAGAEASWEARKLSTDVSAIQHAMNLYCRDKRAFMAEYQCEPQAEVEAAKVELVTADFICGKLNGVDRGIVPQMATRLTVGIDVQQTLLYWAAVAWEENYTGYVVDFGSWPDQQRTYFSYADAKLTLAAATGAASLEGSIFQGLTSLAAEVLGRNWEREDGSTMRVSRALIDANWQPSADAIHQFCRNSVYASVVMPSHGVPTTATRDPYTHYKKKQGERVGTNWRMPPTRGTRLARHVLMDSNFWKSFLYNRLAVKLGDPGCLSVFGREAAAMRMIADHVVSERRQRLENKTTQRQVDVWEQRPGRPDNHLLDCLYAACVAAQIEGVQLIEMKRTDRPEPRKAADGADEAARRRLEFQRARGY